MKIIEVYLQADRYNPRVRATIPGAWVVVFDDGAEVAIARPWECDQAGAERMARERFAF